MSDDPPKPGHLGFEEIEGLLNKQVVSYINAAVDQIGDALEEKINESFITTKYGKTIKQHYEDHIKRNIDKMDENTFEHHLNHLRPKYSIKNKKMKKGGKNRTQKRRKQKGGGVEFFTQAVSNFFDKPKQKIINAIENKLSGSKFTDVIENAFYRASYSLPEPSEKIIETRDGIVTKLFDMSTPDKYNQVKEALLKERCDKKNKRNRKKECKT